MTVAGKVEWCAYCQGEQATDFQTGRCLTCGRLPSDNIAAALPVPLGRPLIQLPDLQPEAAQDDDEEPGAIFGSPTMKRYCECGGVTTVLLSDWSVFPPCHWCKTVDDVDEDIEVDDDDDGAAMPAGPWNVTITP
jgi:hypothetical protein